MKPVAVITNNIPSTFQWLKNEYGVDRIQHTSRIGTNTKTGQNYLLVLSERDVQGWEFSGMLVSPFYHSLEQVVRSRIR